MKVSVTMHKNIYSEKVIMHLSVYLEHSFIRDIRLPLPVCDSCPIEPLLLACVVSIQTALLLLRCCCQPYLSIFIMSINYDDNMIFAYPHSKRGGETWDNSHLIFHFFLSCIFYRYVVKGVMLVV